jgi:tripartite-type tricarboxylate transporter receptor subunit TctC
MLPDVPTVAESGYPGYEAMVWFGMLAPAGLPEPLRQKLTDGLVQTLHAPAMKTYLEQQGAQVSDVAGPAFGTMIKDEISKWCQVVKKADIRLD